MTASVDCLGRKIMRRAILLKIAYGALVLTVAAGAQASCYVVMNAQGKVVSQTQDPPVDMSYQLHQTLPYRYGPGATMTFSLADSDCGKDIDQYYNLTPGNAGYGKRYGGGQSTASSSTAATR